MSYCVVITLFILILVSILSPYNYVQATETTSLFSSVSKSMQKARKKQGKQYHKQAIELAQESRFDEALVLFRAATRSVPGNAHFLNNLGVTEMRLGFFSQAKERFLKVLNEFGEKGEIASDNLEALKEFMTPEEFENLPPKQLEGEAQQHKILDLPKVTLSELHQLENVTSREFLLGNRPFVLAGAMEDWDIDKWRFDNLVEHFGDARVDYYPHNMKVSSVKPFFSTVKNALDQFSNPTGLFDKVDASAPTAYIQWNVENSDWDKLVDKLEMKLPANFRTDDSWIEKCFGEDALSAKFHHRTHWRMVLIGQKGAGMFNHKDTLQSSSFQAQVLGRKRWHICDDSQTPYVYEAGKVNTFQPDYEAFPEMKKAVCYDVVVEAGEMIFYPKNYWHQTINMDDITLAVSGTLVTEENREAISKEFAYECREGKAKSRIFNYEEDLCTGLEECYEEWRVKDWEGDVRRDVEEERMVGKEL